MTYTKPSDVTYTAMAMWIDEHAYTSEIDENRMYEYLYHLSNMLAHQFSYFQNACDYDQFALFSASRLFSRLYNSKQFELDEYNQPRMKKIKSILNYLKKVIYPYKVDFEIEFKIENKNIDVVSTGSCSLSTSLVESSSLFDQVDFSVSVSSVAQIVRSYLSRLPVKKNSSEWINIYLSCMLTLLNSISVSTEILRSSKSLKKSTDDLVEIIYKESKNLDPVLFHLPQSMSNYIKVLVVELRHVIASELSWKSSNYVDADSAMKSLLYAELDKELS